MSRVNYPMKLSELISEAKKALNKYGDRYVMLSDDEEGNGVHECYFTFADAKDFTNGENIADELKASDCVILG